jgi:toxin ParE1/3/4
MRSAPRCVLSPLAETDLEEIGDYIARDNPRRALTFVQELRERCTQITHHPEAAPLRPEFGVDLRLVPFGRYLIFYTVSAKAVRIERILHGARQLQDLFDA